MKRVLVIFAAGITASGCSSFRAPEGETVYERGLDTEYMQVVEQHARRFGTAIIWVNPPEDDEETSDN